MKYYTVIPHSHRQLYAIQRDLSQAGIQTGTGWADALGKIGSMAGKLAANPAIQNLASAGLEMGTTIAGQTIANKLAQGSPGLSNAISTALEQREKIKQLYKAGEVSKAEALKLLKKIQEENQSGGVKALKSLARHQYGRGNVVSIRPLRAVNQPQLRDPISVNRAGGVAELS